MNLVELIQNQITDSVGDKLSSLVGGTEAQTRSAVGAAVPGLLAAMSGLATQGGTGADQLASLLNRFDSGPLRSITGLLQNDPEQGAQQGSGILGSLLGGGVLGSLSGAIARFTGLDSGTVTKLLGMIAPFVLGGVAKQFQGKTITPQGLMGLFNEQKSNIAQALPAGLPLGDIPGAAELRSTVSRVATDTQRAAAAATNSGSSLLKTLLPLVLLALVAFAAWQFLKKPAEQRMETKVATTETQHTVRRPVIDEPVPLPDATRVSGELESFFTNTTEALNGITDAATAEAALPKLTELNTQLDGITKLHQKLPDTARSSITSLIAEQLTPLTQLIEKVLAIPGVKEKLEPVLSGLQEKIKALNG
jgi:hypothetical protein